MERQSDESYRAKLISTGVLAKHLEGLSSHQLDCVGNLRQVYRDGETMKQRDPARFAIMQEAERRGRG